MLGFAKTIAAQQEDFGVLHEPVGNGGSDGGIEENVAPVGEGCVVVIMVDRFWL